MEVYNSSRTAAELEYALGAVPSIGENGNWFIGEEDTGIFAKGINVTGAEVGQTVKVSAVDENGVPTAWEAADPTSDWRLIKTITLEEDIAVIPAFTTDNDGNEFSLSAIRVISSNIATTDAAQKFIRTFFSRRTCAINQYGNRDILTAGAFVEPTMPTAGKCLFAEIDLMGDCCRVALTNSSSQLVTYAYTAYKDRYIEKIMFTSGNQNTVIFAAGSVIQVWGVDA